MLRGKLKHSHIQTYTAASQTLTHMQELHVASHDGDDGDDDVGREAEAAAAAAAEKAAVHVAHVALAPSLSDPFLPQPVCVCVCVFVCL